MKRIKVPLTIVMMAVVLGGTLRAVSGAPKSPARADEKEDAADQPAERPAPAKTTLKQQREASRLVGQFRRAKGDRQKQSEIVDEAVAAGPHVAAAMFSAIGREIYPQLTRYRTKFNQQAAILAKIQMRDVKLEEIAQLRGSVLGLSKRPDFSHDLIVQQGDPAMKRLEEIFLVDRNEVLKPSKELESERKRLQELGELWERCAARVEPPPAADAGPAGGEGSRAKEPLSFEKYLQGEERLAAGLAVPMDPQTREILAVNSQLAGQIDPEEARTILALNLMRNLLGLPPVVIDLKLCAAARDHSSDMQRLKFFAHESPLPGKKTPWDRAKLFGTAASGENIMMGVRDGKAANLGWFHSPGHHKNMLGNHNRVGMGLVGAYFTELLGR